MFGVVFDIDADGAESAEKSSDFGDRFGDGPVLDFVNSLVVREASFVCTLVTDNDSFGYAEK